VEAIELQSVFCQPLGRRGVNRTAKGAARTKADIVNQDDQHVGRAFRGSDIPDRRKLGFRILGVIGRQTHMLHLRDGQNGSLNLIICTHGLSPYLVNTVG
jgi:hypothetical protein